MKKILDFGIWLTQACGWLIAWFFISKYIEGLSYSHMSAALSFAYGAGILLLGAVIYTQIFGIGYKEGYKRGSENMKNIWDQSEEIRKTINSNLRPASQAPDSSEAQ